ncbi:hypothetical protein GEMRC1_012699 [Eukaryota sp. GEM-RC1]
MLRPTHSEKSVILTPHETGNVKGDNAFNTLITENTRQVEKDFIGPTRTSLVDKNIPELKTNVDVLVKSVLIPLIRTYGVEIAVDGCSSKMEAIHNIIITSNGRSFYLESIATEDSIADGLYISSILNFVTTQVSNMIKENTEPELEGIVAEPTADTLARQLYWASLDGGPANPAALQILQSERNPTDIEQGRDLYIYKKFNFLKLFIFLSKITMFKVKTLNLIWDGLNR